MIKRIQGGFLHNLTRLGAAAGLLFLWTLFEKQFIEPNRLYNYMPFYRANGMCVWDVLAIAVIAVLFVVALRRESHLE